MGTRGIIARKTPSGWLGRYHHWDSNPESLGKTLFGLANGFFKDRLKEMMNVLTVQHTGWSTINNKDFSLPPSYIDPGSVQSAVAEAFNARLPQCFCHGGRNDEGWIVRPKDKPHEWAYVVNVKARTMDVLWGNSKKVDDWIFVQTVAFDETEPDWSLVECGQKLERCPHYKYIHDKTICPGCDGQKHQATSGHSAAYSSGQDCSECVTPAALPEPLKTYYFADKSTNKKGWHCYSPKVCVDCNGTGVQTPEQLTLRQILAKQLRANYLAEKAAELVTA